VPGRGPGPEHLTGATTSLLGSLAPGSLAPGFLAGFLFAAGTGLVGLGCETPPAKSPLSYSEDAKRAYDAAMEEFEAHNWLEAQNRLQAVKKKYSYSKYARLAELRLADADFEQEKYAEAIRAYKQYIHDHRSDADEVAYARSRVAEAQYREISDSAIMPAVEERDQATIKDAYKELKSFLQDYPEAKESSHLRELLERVTDLLIGHELAVADFYLRRDKLDAASERIVYALKNYSVPSGMAGPKNREPECLILLGETYLKMRKWPEAREAFALVLERYAQSPRVTQAKRFLAFMKERGV
jgi:outer membrane protein assembly factor BamD